MSFMPRGSGKLVLGGEKMLRIYEARHRELHAVSDFTGVPERQDTVVNGRLEPQTFVSFCYTANDQMIGCTQLGDLFVIQLMDVIQIIDPMSLIAAGTPPGNRTQFRRVVPSRFGFVAATDDVLYFFQFKPSKEGSDIKGTYQCILKWRAAEFKGTHITSISICEPGDGDGMHVAGESPSAEAQDSNIAISTKNNQILYLNLYKQVYYPDYLKIVNDMKNISKNANGSGMIDTPVQSDEEDDNSSMLDSSSTLKNKKKEPVIKMDGIEEEAGAESVNLESNKYGGGKKSQESKKKAQEMKENEALINEIKYTLVANGFHQGDEPTANKASQHRYDNSERGLLVDICIQRPIIATLSKADSTIRVWNYDTGESELVKSYSQLQKEFRDSTQTYLQSIALHPSGFYLAIACIGGVKIYHLMEPEIREYRSLECKGCHTVKFSNGGQLLACIDPQHIGIYHAYTLERLNRLPGRHASIRNLDFNENDTVIAVVSWDGFIQKYELVGKMGKMGECVIDKQSRF